MSFLFFPASKLNFTPACHWSDINSMTISLLCSILCTEINISSYLKVRCRFIAVRFPLFSGYFVIDFYFKKMMDFSKLLTRAHSILHKYHVIIWFGLSGMHNILTFFQQTAFVSCLDVCIFKST